MKKTDKKDHPRIRGEHFYWSKFLWQTEGSSPHSRGTLRYAKDFENDYGIIPAFAGNTQRPL